MLIIGCDFHPGFQQVAIFDNQTGEIEEKRLGHRDGGGAVLPRSGGAGGAGGDGSLRALSVVRAVAGESGHRAVAGRCERRFGPRWCASRRPIGEMPSTSWTCCGRSVFRGSGYRAWKSGMCGSCWCIGTSKCRREPGSRTSCRRMALSQGVQKKRKLWTQAGRAELEKLELLPYAAARREQLLATLDRVGRARSRQLNRQVEEEVKRRAGGADV